MYDDVARTMSPSFLEGSVSSTGFSGVTCGRGVSGRVTVVQAAVAVFGDIITGSAGASGDGVLTVATGSGSLSGDNVSTGVDISADDAVIGVELVIGVRGGGAETVVAVLSRSLHLSGGILGLASRFASLAFLRSFCWIDRIAGFCGEPNRGASSEFNLRFAFVIVAGVDQLLQPGCGLFKAAVGRGFVWVFASLASPLSVATAA